MPQDSSNISENGASQAPFFVNKSVVGILLMIVATALIIAMNAFAKSISDIYDPIETVFMRNGLALILLTAFLLSTRNFDAFKTGRPLGQFGRAFVGTVGLAFVFWGYALMPMADMQALLMTGGIMTVILAPIVLGEKVGPWRWSAVLIGFIGALCIIQPGGESFLGWPALVGLTAAFLGASLVSIFLRSLGRTESAYTTVFYFMMIGTFLTLPYILWSGWQYETGTLIGILGTGICGGASLLLKTQAYRYAEASLLSPVIYTGIVWAILFGWIGFGDWPTMPVWIGSALIVGANIVILWREHQKEKDERKDTA